MSRGFGSTYGAGTSDVVKTNISASFTQNLTISIWAFLNGAGGGSLGRLFSQPNTGSIGSDLAVFYKDGNNLQIQFPGSSGSYLVDTNFLPPLDEWFHICLNCIYSASAPRIDFFYNGAYYITVVGSSTPLNLGTNWLVGNRSDSVRNWDGMADHFSLWSGINLDNGAIQALANGMNPLLINPDSLVSYLPLDGVNKPEFDFINGYSSSITGTSLGTSEPPVQPLPRIKRLWDYETGLSGTLLTFTQALLDEFLGNNALSKTLLSEILATGIRGQKIPFDNIASLLIDNLLPLENTSITKLTLDKNLPFESTGSLTSAKSFPYESISALLRDSAIPNEWISKLTGQEGILFDFSGVVFVLKFGTIKIADSPAFTVNISIDGSMSQTIYDIQDIVQLQANFADITGTIPTDPTSVLLYVKTPDGNVQEFTYASGAIVRVSTGVYTYNFQLSQSGIHAYRFTGTGACIAGKEQNFSVQTSKIISG